MSRKKKANRKDAYIGLRLPDALHKQIVAVAEANQRNVSDAVRLLLEQKLEQLSSGK